MSLHRCTDSECPYLGQATNKGCACHLSDVEVLTAINAELVEALGNARSATQAFLDMVNVVQRFQTLPIPAILETAQHNCPIIIAEADAALAKAKGA